MQARIGKKRCFKRAWWTSRGALTSLFVGSLVLVGLQGCASKKIKDPTILKSMDSICLTGQGKGRIEYSGGRHVFNYESLWQPEEDKWSLALGLPLIGQELLVFELPKKDKRSHVSGTFAKRLKNEVKSKRMRFLLGAFYKNLADLLKIIKDRKTSLESSAWQIYMEKGDFFAKSNVGKNYVFKLRAFEWDKKYERLTMSLSEKNKAKASLKLLNLELFVSRCDLN